MESSGELDWIPIVTTITFSPNPIIKGFGPQDDFTFTVMETPYIASPGDSHPTQILDALVNAQAGATVDNNFQLSVSESLTKPGIRFTNQTPTICNLDNKGNVARIVDGIASIEMSAPYGKRRYSRQLSRTGDAIVAQFINYAPDCLAQYVSDRIDQLMSGITPGSSTQDIWLNGIFDPNNPAGSRNSNLFATEYDFTPVSFTQGGGGYGFPYTLISSRHVIGANHVINSGSSQKIVWKASNGDFYSANTLAYQTLGGDIGIFYLDRDVQAISGIIPAKVLPMNYASSPNKALPSLTINGNSYTVPCFIYSSNSGNASGIPDTNVINTNSNHLRIIEIFSMGSPVSQLLNLAKTTKANRLEFYSQPYSGDSGSPIFIPVSETEMALLGHLWSSDAAPSIASYFSQINSALNSTACAANTGDNTTYALQSVDLSNFTPYE